MYRMMIKTSHCNKGITKQRQLHIEILPIIIHVHIKLLKV